MPKLKNIAKLEIIAIMQVNMQGAAYRKLNLKYSVSKQIAVICHNG